MQPALGTIASAGLPAGLREAEDMTDLDWEGLTAGLAKFLAEEAQEPEHAEDEPPAAGAGVMFVTPEGHALFLKRSDSGDHAGEWCFPGGGIEGEETPAQAAAREAGEELGGRAPDGALDDVLDERETDGVNFTTFGQVTPRFIPKIDGEHVDYVWAHYDDPPQPLHPGVAETLKKLAEERAGMAGAEDDFEESKHPRGEGGKFSSGGSAESGGSGWSANELGDFPDRRPNTEGGSGWSEKELEDFAEDVMSAAENAEGKLSERTEAHVGAVGSKQREGLAEGDFLEPASKKYPVKEGGKYSRKLLLAAAREARMHGHEDLAKRADAIREREFGTGAEDDEVEAAMDRALRIAMDRDSVRDFDKDGRMHVQVANISKANICPYLGKEIPGWEELGLDPDKVYRLLRDPEELKRGAPTFDGIQLLKRHEPVSVDDHRMWDIVGTTGTGTKFEHPYLQNSLHVWTKDGVDLIESGEQREISSGYHYDPDMTPGEYEGKPYDGRMTNIRGNHVALVKDGRAGPDVVVGDSAEELQWAAIEAAIGEVGLAA